MKKWLCLVSAIFVEISATLALKAALEAPEWYVVVVAGYVGSFALLAICLRLGMSISVAYGVWGGGGVTVTALASALLFGEKLSWLMGMGMALILAGVFAVEIGSHHSRRSKSAEEL